MSYTPDPAEVTEPIGGRTVQSAAAEFRAIKAVIASLRSQVTDLLEAGIAGSPNYVLAGPHVSILGDGVTDDVAAINTVIANLAASGGGTLIFPGTAAGYYINGTVKLQNRVKVIVYGNWVYGPYGRCVAQGKLEETPATGQPQIRATSGASVSPANRLYLANNASSNHTNFSAGDRIVVRGENDATGVADTRESAWVASVVPGDGSDLTTNYLVLESDLQNTYEPSYPSSAWPNDKTLITKVTCSKLTADAERHGQVVTVQDGTKFAVGDWVVIEDDKLCSDISGTSANPIHIETNQIAAISGNDLTLQFTLAHDYETAFRACVQVMLPVIDASVHNALVTYNASSIDNNKHAFSSQYALRCFFLDSLVTGNRGHGFRIGEGSAMCAVDACMVYKPSFVGAGQGYGATCYSGARFNIITNSQFIGTRHAVLLFRGCANTLVVGNQAVDNTGAAFDAHGAEEVDALFANNSATVGYSTSGDISLKSAYKVGNPTHRAGAINVTFSGNTAAGYVGPAFHILPTARNIKIIGNSWDAGSAGVLIEENSNDIALGVSDIEVSGNTCNSTAGSAVEVDFSQVVANRISVLRNTFQVAAGVPIIDLRGADSPDIGGNVLNGSSVASYSVRVRNSENVTLFGDSVRDVQAGVRVENSPGLASAGGVYRGVATNVLLSVQDNGGSPSSDGLQFTGYEAVGFTPQIVLAGMSGYSNVVCAPARHMPTQAASGLSLPVTYTGASNQIPIDSTPPLVTEGNEIVSVAVTPARPVGILDIEVVIPYVSIDTADNAVLAVFVGSTLVGLQVTRLTAGASAGSSIIWRGQYTYSVANTATTFTVSARLGCRNSGPQLEIGGQFGSTANRPSITIRERGV